MNGETKVSVLLLRYREDVRGVKKFSEDEVRGNTGGLRLYEGCFLNL